MKPPDGRAAEKAALACSLLFLFALSARAQSAATDAPAAIQHLLSLFEVKELFARMADKLEYLRNCFTLVGITAVMISAIRHVAKARTSEESMGWVASVVLTIGLMATAPKIGDQIFKASEALAESTKFTNASAIKTCWDSLIQLLPGESPVIESVQDASPVVPLPKNGPVQKEDGSWTKMAWTYMKEAWSSMTTALSSITGAFRSVANRIVILVVMIVPSVALLIGMLAITIATILREFLHQTMDVFLPMMIAFASFPPMRGPATTFVTKYISIALWPLAWAIGNGIAISLLVSLMGWIVEVSRRTLAVVTDAATPIAIKAGIVFEAASSMPWVLIIVIAFFITVSALLILASAVAAPKALDAMLTKGVEFAGVQFSQAAASAKSISSMAQSMPGPSISGGGGGGFSAPNSQMMSAAASKAGAGMSAASGKLAGVAAAGGPIGIVAGAVATMLAKAGSATTSMALSAGEGASSDKGGDTPLPPSFANLSIAQGSSTGGKTLASPPTSPRAHRRLPLDRN